MPARNSKTVLYALDLHGTVALQDRHCPHLHANLQVVLPVLPLVEPHVSARLHSSQTWGRGPYESSTSCAAAGTTARVYSQVQLAAKVNKSYELTMPPSTMPTPMLAVRPGNKAPWAQSCMHMNARAMAEPRRMISTPMHAACTGSGALRSAVTP